MPQYGINAIFWLTLVTALAAAAAAGFTLISALVSRRAIIASNLVNCLHAYVNLMRYRTQAKESNNEQLCIDYYRELFDLHWNEFQLWREGLIPDHVMKAWLAVRHRNFKNKDGISFVDKNGNKVTVSYDQVWNELVRTDYFEGTDPFVPFMEKIHTVVATDLKKLRREFKKR